MLFQIGGTSAYRDKLELYQVSTQILKRQTDLLRAYPVAKEDQKNEISRRMENLRVIVDTIKRPC